MTNSSLNVSIDSFAKAGGGKKIIMVYENLEKYLPDSELRKLFNQMKQGDNVARQEIMKHNLVLIKYVISSKFYSTGYELEELTSVGYLGLNKAVDTFDESLNIKFYTYAYVCIKNAILMFLHKNKKYYAQISLQKELYDDSYELGDTIASSEEIFSEQIINEANNKYCLKYALNYITNLNKRDKYIIEHYFGLNGCKYTKQADLADKFNISQNYLSRVIKYHLENIRLILALRGVEIKSSLIRR